MSISPACFKTPKYIYIFIWLLQIDYRIKTIDFYLKKNMQGSDNY